MNRVVVVSTTKVAGEHYVEVTGWYRDGGYSYATSTVESRGYGFTVVPVRIEEFEAGGKTFAIRRLGAFTGTKCFMTEAKSFSQKQFDAHIAASASWPRLDEIVARLTANITAACALTPGEG